MNDEKKLFSDIDDNREDSKEEIQKRRKGNISQLEEMAATLESLAVRTTVINRDAAIASYVSQMMKERMLDADFTTMANNMKAIYREHDFRHSYSNISSIIYTTLREEKNLECLRILSSNSKKLLSTAKHIFTKEDEMDIIEKFVKLNDHIKLEVVRICDYENMLENAYTRIDEIKKKAHDDLEETRKQQDRRFTKYENGIKKSKEELDNIYSQFVSILGIFAAVVIVFFGGASVFTKIFEKLETLKWYQIGIGVSFTGLVLFNVIFMFLYILSKLIKRDISSLGVDESGRQNPSKHKCYFGQVAEKYPYLFWFNLLLVITIIICIIAEH